MFISFSQNFFLNNSKPVKTTVYSELKKSLLVPMSLNTNHETFVRIGTPNISLFKIKDNLHTIRKGLDSLIRKIENKEIISDTTY